MYALAAQETVLELKTPACLCGEKNIVLLPEKKFAYFPIFSSHVEKNPNRGKPLNANFWCLSFHWSRKLGAKWWDMRAEEGTQMSLLVLMSRTSSLGPGSATERHGHLPLQKFNEKKGISVTLRKGAFMEVFVGLFPFVFVFSISFFLDYQSLSFRNPCSKSFLCRRNRLNCLYQVGTGDRIFNPY